MPHPRDRRNRIQQRRHIILYGDAFSGKGSAAAAIEEHYGATRICRITTGNITRDKIQTDSNFRKSFSRLIDDNGGLVPDDAMIPLTWEYYQKRIREGYEDFVWDGFGRTAVQIEEMVAWGVLTSHYSRFIELGVTPQAKQRRLQLAIETGERSHRGDNGSLTDRSEVFAKNRFNIMIALRRASIRPRYLNTDESPKRVHGKVLAIADEVFAHQPAYPSVLGEDGGRRIPYDGRFGGFREIDLLAAGAF